MPLAPGLRLGAYEILSLLGAGGMGEVYRARDTRLGRVVAIKVLTSSASDDETARERLFREARTISSLDHPNICALYDVGREEGIDYLVMQYLEGETLAAQLRRGPLPLETAVRYATEIANALAAAHSRGIIHRDLKPGNVMITPGAAKLLDFGLATLRRPSEASASATTLTTESVLTGPGMVVGTLPYMAPEQVEGRAADARSDIFSFGTVFYEMLTGTRPFVATPERGVVTAILGTTPPLPSRLNPRVPAVFDAIVARCLAKDAGERWQRIGDVLTAMTAAAAPVSKRRPRWGYAAAAAVIAIIAVVLARDDLLPDFGDTAEPSGITAQATTTVVAVLPFEVDSNDPAERAYWIGLSEAVAAKLAQLPATMRVHVASAADVASRDVRTAEDARLELGATRIIRGRVGQTSGALQASVELIDTRTSQTSRSTIVRTERSDPAASQNALLEAVLSLLEISPTASVRARLRAPQAAPGAYDYYLQAVGYLQDYDRPENLDAAIAVLKRALELDPNHAPAYAGLGRAYWRKYDSTRDPQWVDTARQACERALALDEAEAAPHLCLGTVESGVGRYEKAVEEYHHALEREPDNEVAYLGLASAYHRLKDVARAEETYLRAVGIRPRYWFAHSALGTFYYQTARYAEAEQAFKQVIALSPDSWRAYSNLGGVHYAQGRARDAVAAFEQSLTLRPNYQAASNLGTVYFYELGDYRRAATAFQHAIGINNTQYVLWGNLAWALHWSGDAAPARHAFEQAVTRAEARRRVNLRDAAVLMALAEFRAALGATDEAHDLAAQALALAPDNPRLLYSAGVLHEYAFRERDQAIEFLARALARGHPWKEIERDPGLARLRSDGGLDRLRQRFAANAARKGD